MKILLADDETGALEVLREEVCAVLPDAEVTAFQFPSKALEYAKEQIVDVAFLDVEMPQMSGLELAKQLKKINVKMNIIFVTAYQEYGIDAIRLRASGYLLKPVNRQDVLEEINALRYPVEESAEKIYIRTFGQFDVFIDGRPITFHRTKSKEVLAYLTDRRGGSVTKRELASVLFEDREYDLSTQDYLNKIIRDLDKTLREVHAEKILIRKRNCYAVDPEAFCCDFYEYEKGNPKAINAFTGEYMRQYAWGEYTLGTFF